MISQERSCSYIVSLLLVVIIWCGWLFYTYPDSWTVIHSYWQVTVTMIFGSVIAGATSEGGGAIAFPVFTKVLHIPPADAKVFSLAIQSVGMVAASIAIIMMRAKVLWRVIVWVSLGGWVGMIIGSVFLSPLLAPAMIRMLFTIMAISLAFTLIRLSTGFRLNYLKMPEITIREIAILLTVGIVGGVISGLVGSGIDMLCFSVLVLLFRISESIATPTSVILMAINSVFGVLLHIYFFDGINTQVQAYWLAAVPVVVVGAPLGAYLCSRMHYLHIRYLLIALICIELVTSLWLLYFDRKLIIFSISTLILFLAIMISMSRARCYMRTSEQECV
ncbi:MAG TPA: sulfite exporter TauE/SafE family protein [Methyloprofundus sp.]|uniref:sulfite exporter TauE/SafE family protein n=1 Tax=Methyloprofundus sp. TaxID=2020875 RepID=UPI0017EE8460|nr:sulfite exporter TauE/SafE family protein [Methyloprofundus sp.]HIG65800.1 sulfite exporter TauE/SafE family protein [Methyloprofundus sp.]HIL78078.1 sulfite exporter TauE/SafE family protein [Methylococcales bacterium]